jgi:hypothetical protein
MKSKNQTESLKFRKEDGEISNVHNNILTSEQHRIWKRRNKVKATLVAGTAVVGVSGGIGIGYGISHPGVQIAKSLVISNAQDIVGNVGTSIANTNALSCATDTGDSVTDVVYTATGLAHNNLQINSSNGIISGTPDKSGFGTYTVTATADGLRGSVSASYAINTELPTSLEITGVEDITGNKNTPLASPRLYCATNTGVVVSDAKYAMASDSELPDGLKIDEETGVISGTPNDTTDGVITCTINVSSNKYNGLVGSTQVSITIGAQIAKELVITGVPTDPINGTPNYPIDPINLTCATDTGITVTDAQYSASNLPAGLRIDSNNGQGTISGTPTTQMIGACTINATSASVGLFSTTIIKFIIMIPNTLVISPATLDSDATLATACNLEIDSSSRELSKKTTWSNETNTAFNNYLDDLGQNEHHINTIQFEGISSVASRAFDGCTALRDRGSIENVKFVQSPIGDDCSIDHYAFYGCTGLKRIDLSSTNIASIGTNAFAECTGLTSINFPNSLESIGLEAFTECTAITIVDLSNTAVDSIGEDAFEGCANLITLNLSSAMFASENSASIGDDAFARCTKLSNIFLPAGITTALGDNCNSNAFFGCPESGTIYYSGDSSLAKKFKEKFDGLSG